MRRAYAHIDEGNKNSQNNSKKNYNKKKDTEVTNDNEVAGAGRRPTPQERQRESGYFSSDNRSRHTRDESTRRDSRDHSRYSRDHSRDKSRDRYRQRRYSERSTSREKRRHFEEDRDWKASYGNNGRY